MDFNKIISISGMSGLYKVVAKSANGFIVESLADGKRIPAYSTYKISTLEDISIYTKGDNVPLKEVLQKLYVKHEAGPGPDHKLDEKTLTGFFTEILPDYDAEKVHFSDIRKLFGWYNILHKTDYLKPGEEKKEAGGEEKPDLLASEEKTNPDGYRATSHVPHNLGHGQIKTHAPKVKPQGVRKTGVA